jgi:hypothetical protein
VCHERGDCDDSSSHHHRPSRHHRPQGTQNQDCPDDNDADPEPASWDRAADQVSRMKFIISVVHHRSSDRSTAGGQQ